MIHDPEKLKLGKRAPRHDPRTLLMTRYAAPTLVPPKRMDWSLGVNSWPMLANDSIGDCAIAGPAHMIQAWTSNNGEEYIPTEAEVIRDYSAVSGYVPGDDSTDVGCVMLDVMNYWRRVGRSDRTGIWHETYLVRAGEYEAIYGNTATRGLGKAGRLVPVGQESNARGRLGAASKAEVVDSTTPRAG